jgi:hypothetical protein
MMKFGVVRDHDGAIVNHRPLLKVVLNPFLRVFGYQIVSIFRGDEFVGYSLSKCAPRRNIFRNLIESWFYT